MASDSIFADPRAAFGPESRPLDWNKQGMGAGDIGGLEMAGGGGTRFGWGVSVEVPSKSPSAAASACSSAGDKRRVRGPSRSQSSASIVIGGVCAGGASAGSTAPVDDPVVVKNLTSQVEASSITTRNGAIQREMQDAYRKLICANVERKLTLQDVASFSTFLVGVRVRLHEKGSNLRRRHSVLSSLLKHAPRARVQRIYSDLAAVEEQESALTKDVDLFNKLQQDLKESPAYKAMMEYGHSSGMVNVDGTMMPDPSKHPELEAMASMSVKDMLAEFKMEDKRNERQNSGRAATQPGDARIAGSGVSSGGGGVGLAGAPAGAALTAAASEVEEGEEREEGSTAVAI